MGIVSYAQNFEDVMLWRALGDRNSGFWIDVGAADPDHSSVTRAFSERGWRGVNVEPTAAFFARLQAARPDDVNLNVALGAAAGRFSFYDCEDATLSSLDAAVAARNRADGRAVQQRTIEVMTLAEVCRQHAPADIHFLKIDVEGAEAQVLAGADFSTYRPWIVVVEATLPLTQVDASAAWEPALLAARYRFAWFDGLNRFYIADEH
jgi:FkbM family methyltransferase